jgi:hypothetical protein
MKLTFATPLEKELDEMLDALLAYEEGRRGG